MELVIMNEAALGQVTAVEWNNEEIKKEVAEKVEMYKTIVYTDESIKQARVDRALLNGFKTALENKRKEIKKICLSPYEDFEKKIKEIVAVIDEPIAIIDSQIKEYEEGRKQQKLEEIENFFNELLNDPKHESLKEFLDFNNVFNPKWTNLSTTMKSIKTEITEMFEQTEIDVNTIESWNTKYMFEVRDMYKRTRDLAKSMQEYQRLEKLEAEKDAFEAKKAEEAATSAPVPEAITEVAEPEQAEPQKTVAEEIYCIDFRVRGTASQLSNLKEYMTNNGIMFGKVE